jgi:tRNA(Ile)-lysidine synthase
LKPLKPQIFSVTPRLRGEKMSFVALTVQHRVSNYIRARSLMRAGERVAVAASGGADSVALLRILLELRGELGVVISIAHFHHGIRAAEADADEAFVAELAKIYDLELYLERGDAREHSRQKKISLETAARELRHEFFAKLLAEKKVHRIATAHTRDDQAETVLMKAVRGAGTRGLSGIFPEQRSGLGTVVRPLLEIRREELRQCLRLLQQPWREDQSNTDVGFTRNRVRARVLPMLREELNPSTDIALAHVAEIARAEEEYWEDQLSRLLPLLVIPGEPTRGGGRRQTSAKALALDIRNLEQQPLAVQRRLLRAAAETLGCNLDFEHVQAIVQMLCQRSSRGTQGKTIEIAKGWRARMLFRELRLESFTVPSGTIDYEHRLSAPGEIRVAELGTRIRARISKVTEKNEKAAYNRAHSIHLPAVPELIVRNWRAGDRFQAGGHLSAKRVKELLYPLHLAEEEKRVWPVVLAGDRIVWVRGIDSPELRTAAGELVWIEEIAE